jgi:predicted O-methyltransferase YrrM
MKEEIEKLKPNSIHDIITPNFFFELGTGHDEYLKSGRYYEYYYAISKYYQPKSILEIGVRYGYSLGSMIKGSDNIQKVLGLDIDAYEKNSLKIAEENIKTNINPNIEYEFLLKSSHEFSELPDFYDIIHIDGDHSYEGKVQDLNLTIGHCKVVIVDDYNNDYFLDVIKNATNNFVEKNKEYIKNTYFLDSARGTFIIEMK